MPQIGIDNFNDALPVAPSGFNNVKWQADPPASFLRNGSAYVPNFGSVDARTTTVESVIASSLGMLVTLTNASPVAVTLGSLNGIANAVVHAGGTGYAVNDTFSVGGAGTGARGIVNSVSSGVVTGLTITREGTGYALASGVATTALTGVGTGLTVDILQLRNGALSGFVCWLVNEGAGLVTVTPASGNIDGLANLTLIQYQGIVVFWDGTNWWTTRGLAVPNPLPVNMGGTGLSTLTAHDVLVGAGTSNVTLISPSLTGKFLMSNGTGADPSFNYALGGVDARTTTTETVTLASRGKLVTFTNAGAIAVTLDSTIAAGFLCAVEDLGAGSATLTPSSGNINGVANLVLATGNGGWLFFDGTNWFAVTGGGGGTTSPLTTKGDIWGYSTVNARIPVGSDGQFLKADSTQTLGVKWVNEPFDVLFNPNQVLGSGAIYDVAVFVRTVVFPGNFSGAAGHCRINPGSTQTINVNKNGSSIGTISITNAGAFTFTTTAGATQTFNSGDYMTFTNQAGADTGMVMHCTLTGTR